MKTKLSCSGPTSDGDDFSRVGNGEDHNSLVIDVAPIDLLEKVKYFQQDDVFSLFHFDATFKLSEIGYPVITCGFSDSSRKYHLAAMFVVRRLTNFECASAICTVASISKAVSSET